MVKQTKWEWFIMEIMRYTLKWDEQNGSEKKGFPIVKWKKAESCSLLFP